MTTTDLRITDVHWRQLRRHLATSFRSRGAEAGAIGLLGRCSTRGRDEYLVTEVLWPGPQDLKLATDQSLIFDASYIRRAHVAMRQGGLAGLVMFHSHPFADTSVAFSRYDNIQEPQLYENLVDIEPSTILASVVFGKQSQCGRLWHGRRPPAQLGQLVVVGETLQEHNLDGSPPPPPPPPSAIFDRGLVVTNAGALARLARMRIAIVGASGTGSIVCELLARAGCRSIMAIDDDVAKDVNLNRILYATQWDVEQQTPKVEILRRGIDALGLGCHVEPVDGNILERDILHRLTEADVIFGCVDAAYPRLLLCQFAYQYLRPYIDVGSEIGGDEKGVVALMARTSYVAPGRHCLQCSGIITSRQLTFESLSYEERQRTIALGYSDDLTIVKPAVMDLNMRAASSGVMLLRHLLQPFLLQPVPVTISENLVTYTTLAIPKARAANPDCPVCQANKHVGWGDNGPRLGLDDRSVALITGRPIEGR